jgi:hypothetical protein
LAGDHLRVIAHPGLGAAQLREAINQQVSGVPTVERGEPTLEDVFLSLAKG